jgi:hypothetical protein
VAEPESGLRNPERAARGLAAACLSFEAVTLLLAIVPMRMMLDDPAPAVTVLLVLTGVCVALAGMARRPWVWPAGSVVPAALVACWPLHWSLGVAGVVFGLVWGYCWRVKHQLNRPPKR